MQAAGRAASKLPPFLGLSYGATSAGTAADGPCAVVVASSLRVDFVFDPVCLRL